MCLKDTNASVTGGSDGRTDERTGGRTGVTLRKGGGQNKERKF